jgi:hypothetical protein
MKVCISNYRGETGTEVEIHDVPKKHEDNPEDFVYEIIGHGDVEWCEFKKLTIVNADY